MTLSPFGTVQGRWAPHGLSSLLHTADPEQADLAYLGWEMARAAQGLSHDERRTLAALAAATLAAVRSGSTRIPIDARLEAVMQTVGAAGEATAARALVARAKDGSESDPVTAVIGRRAARTPLIVEGDWLYAQKMRVLDERFCAHVRERAARPADDVKGVAKVLKAVANGPPPLTDEQKRAVKAALTGPFTLVTGGPGTGKTTIVVTLLRALAWTGVPMGEVAVATPTGKAAQRLQQAIDAGLASAQHEMTDATLRAIVPVPQTLHRLLGFSPSTGRFARHENDRIPHRVVVVDEASMVDLAMMDRLLRAMKDGSRLVLLGDADQLPSVEAGAVFRDLCACMPVVRLTLNLRVARDPAAQRIVVAAEAVNAGELGSAFAEAVPTRPSADALSLAGPEILAGPWPDVQAAFLDRWWRERAAGPIGLETYASRTFRLRDGVFDPDAEQQLRSALDHHASCRLLCATRVRGTGYGAEDVNERLIARLPGGPARLRRWRMGQLLPGVPVMVQRSDFVRQLYNGDQGVVARVDAGLGVVSLAAVFARRDALEAFPLDGSLDLSPAFAMTVHKAQGSEFDHVAFVLPEDDMPMLTRELIYTAITRARRSVQIVGRPDLLARAVSRRIERHSGIAERLANTSR